MHAGDSEIAQLLEAGGGGREGPVDMGVNPPREVRHRTHSAGDVVALGETDEVGLVDRDTRHADVGGRGSGLQTQRRGRSDVDDVRPESQQLAS